MLGGQVLASLRHHCPTIRGGKLISRIHSKLGTAGFVVAIVALVAALSGAAIAATGLNGKQKKEVTKIAKKYAGKDGAPGAPGLAGAPGAKGDTGATGPEGPPGPEGDEGPPGPEGDEGPEGPEGSPWTAGGVLPSSKTETGVWGGSINFSASEIKVAEQASFNIPLTAAPTVNLIQKNGTANPGNVANCPGTPSDPKANPGHFCAYAVTEAEEPEGLGIGGGNITTVRAFKTGVLFLANVPAFSAIGGSWAVTAP
jgi:hypothetical protein